MKFRRPSPALVISVGALTVACTGTAFAATIISSSSQIKNGVVSSGDIKDGSLQARDLKSGTITESKLSKGVVAKLGGGAAASGDTTAYEAIRHSGPENQPANVVVKIATLSVPPGAYKVTAQTIMSAVVPGQDPVSALVQANGLIGGSCRLDAAGDGTEGRATVVVNGRQAPATLTMQTTRTVGAQSDFTLSCSSGVPWRTSETSIIATKVSNIVRTEVTG